jgi:hypothetical protein
MSRQGAKQKADTLWHAGPLNSVGDGQVKVSLHDYERPG